MRIIIVAGSRRFKREAALTRKLLRQLGLFLDLGAKAVEVHLVGDGFMRKNVLAFPASQDFPRPDLKPYQALGEIYLNPACIRRQGNDFVTLLVHGLLHLLGYDHTINREQAAMNRKEKELLNRLRLVHGRNQQSHPGS